VGEESRPLKQKKENKKNANQVNKSVNRVLQTKVRPVEEVEGRGGLTTKKQKIKKRRAGGGRAEHEKKRLSHSSYRPKSSEGGIQEAESTKYGEEAQKEDYRICLEVDTSSGKRRRPEREWQTPGRQGRRKEGGMKLLG